MASDHDTMRNLFDVKNVGTRMFSMNESMKAIDNKMMAKYAIVNMSNFKKVSLDKRETIFFSKLGGNFLF